MRRALAIAALLAATAAVWVGLPRSASAAPGSTSREAVLVIAPYLTWSDITPTATPTLWRLASDGVIGDLNARSRAREQREPASPIEGALSISAGSWAVQDPEAAAAFGVRERYEIGTAAEAYRRSTGGQVGENRIVFLGLPMTQRVNAERSYEISLGALGESIEQAGGYTVAIGNSDIGYTSGEQRRVRPAALAAMSARGLVRFGDVSSAILRSAPTQPFGLETDVDAFARTLAQARRSLPPDAPSLIVLDPGDLYRAKKFSEQVTDVVAAEQRARAVATLEKVVALAAAGNPDILIIASQSTGDPSIEEPEGLGPLIIAGGTSSGLVLSNSTQRPGLTTNPDVAATILDRLGVSRPVEFIGSPIAAGPGPANIEQRIDLLTRMNDTALAVDEAKRIVVNTFVGFTVAILAFAAFVLTRGAQWRPGVLGWWIRILQGALLLVLSVPMSGWLMFSWMPWPRTASQAVVGVLVTAAAVWALGLLLWWKTRMRVPVAALSLATVATILVDQWLGAPASFTNFFGYSPLLAARFYGLGNEGAAIVFGASVVGMALLFDEWPATRLTVFSKRFALPLVGTAVMFTAAAPFLGANIGVAIWGTIGFALAWFLMNGHHVSWKTVFWVFVAVAVVIAAFAAIDLFGGGAQTHLGRAITSAEKGGIGELWQIVARKAETNARILTRTNWSYILVATLGFLAFMRWRPQGDFGATLESNPDFGDAVTVSLVAGLVAYFTEDSGIVIPALEVFYIGVALAWLMLGRALETSRRSAIHAVDDDRESER